MQRYRFLDLYPYDIEDLKVLGHLSRNGSIDLVDKPDETHKITSIPPYGSKPDDLNINQKWIDDAINNTRRAESPEQLMNQVQQDKQNVKKRMPQEVHHLYREIQNCHIHFQPPNVDDVINRVLGFQIIDPQTLVRNNY